MAKETDWETIESEYRAGQLSVSEIGRQHKISHTAINKRAKKEGWTRSLVQKVREAVSTKLVSDGVSAATDRETVEQAATRVVVIVREHRADIAASRSIVRSLLTELSEASEARGEIEDAIEEETRDDQNGRRRSLMLKAVSLSTRATTMTNLSSALKNVVALERQAFNLDTKDGLTDGETPAGIEVRFVSRSAPVDDGAVDG